MPRRTASSGKAQKYPIIAIAIMHQPILNCVSRAMSDTPKTMIRCPFPSCQGPCSGLWGRSERTMKTTVTFDGYRRRKGLTSLVDMCTEKGSNNLFFESWLTEDAWNQARREI